MIYLDMDGVLVDFVTGISRQHNRPNPYDDPQNHGKYNMEELWGITADEFLRPCGFDFWANLPPMEDFQDYKTLPVHGILTRPTSTNTEECRAGKLAWVRRHWPEMSGRVYFEREKARYAARGVILIDDDDKNIESWRTSGGIGVQVPRPWNSLHDLVGMLRLGVGGR